MKKFRLLLCVALLSFAMPKTLLAWNDGDTLHIVSGSGKIYYQVNSRNLTLRVIGSSNVTNMNLPTDGKVKRNDVEFTITEIGGFYAVDQYGIDFTGVQTISIPNTVTHLSLYGLVNSSVTSIFIPASTSYINSESWLNMQQISVDVDNPYFDSLDGILYTENFKKLVSCPPQKVFPNGTFTPQDVDTIGMNAFYNSKNLKTLNIPATVKYFEKHNYSIAFTMATSLTAINVVTNNPYFCNINNDGVVYTKDKKTLVAYPPAKNASGSFTVPTTVTKIDTLAFSFAKINSINLSNVERIEDWAFYTAALRSLAIPKSMKTINGGFPGATGIATITVDAANTNFKIMYNALYTSDGKTFVLFPSGNTSITGDYPIASGTEVIATKSIWWPRFKSLHIPASVTTIAKNSMHGANSCTSIIFDKGSKLKTIGEYGIWGYALLEELALPASLEVIDQLAFCNNPKLKTVTIEAGSKLKSIGGRCFYRCPELSTFKFEGSSTLDSIGWRTFADTKLKSFDFPATIRYIGESAFGNCRQLSSVVFPADNVSILDTICSGAFANTAFTLTRIPSSVRCIGREAFWNVKTSPSLAISSRTDSISPEAFKGCYTLKALNVDKANQKYSSLGGMLLTKDKETLVLFPPGKAGEKFNLLAPSLRRIGDYAFYENQLLTSVIIPNRVTSLGKRAFGLCPNLNTVTLLCENYLDPANIAQLLNEATFDDGVTTTTDYRKNIALHVRKHLLSQYENEPYYDLYFKSIAPSFNPMKNPANAAEGLNANEEYIAVSQNEASLIAASSPDETYVVPKTVNRNRLDQYTVAMVGDYAFHGCSPGTSEVVVPGEVSYVGAKSFLSDTASVAASTIKSIFLLAGPQDERTFSTTRFELDDTGNDYSEFANNTKVYVRKSTYNSTAFQNAVTRYTVGNSVHPRTRNMFSYQIPGISITKSYGTFAREFDVDLSEYARELEEQYGPDAGGRVFAFAAPVDRPGSYFKPGGGDNPEAKGTYYVRFTSLEHTRADGTIADGTYIPANTGVLLKSWDGLTQTDDDFFYCIGEDGDGMAETPAQSFLVGVTRNKAEVKDTGRNIFVMSGGLFKPLNGQTVASFPLHKAYLKLDGFPGATTGAKVMLVFDDDTVPTTIGSPGADEGMEGTGDIHDLQGRRVTAPRKGIYVRNGKKIVIK